MTTEPTRRGAPAALPWIIAALAVAALVATLVWDRGGPADADADALARLTERLDALESGGANVEPGSRRVPPAATAAGTRAARAGAAGIGSLDAQASPEEAARERDAKLRELESRFARDAADPVGGGRTEDTLVQTISSEAMAGTGLKPSDVDIACKQNSCRVVGTFDRMGDAQDWSLFYITAAGGNVLAQTQMVFVPLPDGRTEVRIFSDRAGR